MGDSPVSVGLSGLNANETITVRIVDTYGREQYLSKQTADDRGYMDLEIKESGNWDSGIYVISIYSEKGSVQTKVMKR